jgi:DNA-binding transcriptional LysR family regulator
MSDRLNQIATFVEVARQGSFVRAAERLGVNVSATSRSVAALEQRLGVRLFQRTTRRVTLTEAGRTHYARCEALLNEFDDAEAAVAHLSGSINGTLRVTIPAGLGATHIVPYVASFLARHPGLELDLNLANRIVDLVEEGYDLAIRVGGRRDARLVVRKLGSSRRVLVASPAYLERHGTPRTPAALAGHALLVLEVGVQPRTWRLVNGNDELVLDTASRVRSSDAIALARLCADGAGITLVPGFVVAGDLASGRLVRVLPRWASPEQEIHAIYPANRFIPAKVRAFVEYMEGILREVK